MYSRSIFSKAPLARTCNISRQPKASSHFFQKFHAASASLSQVPGTPSPTEPSKDDALRLRLKDDLKTAMKSKDTMSSTVIRSVMSTINNAEKEAKKNPLGVLEIIHKAKVTRLDSAERYRTAGREDLAEKETQEANLLTKYLPEPLTQEEVDAELTRIIRSMSEEKNMGRILKAFYERYEKQAVDGGVVAASTKRLLAAS